MPGIPANITIEGRTPATIKGRVAPLIDTAEAARGGYRAGDNSSVSLIFSDNFNDQTDWAPLDSSFGAATFRWDGDVMPVGWDAAYNDLDRYSANKNIRISASDSEDARGGTGRCLKCFRENHYNASFPNQFNSNGTLGKLLTEGLDDIYIEFYIKFSPGWTYSDGVNANSKLFRVFSSPGEISEFWSAFGGQQGPLFFWAWVDDANFGVRNALEFRGGPYGENYNATNYADTFLTGLGRGLVSLGDASMNWTSDLQGALSTGATPVVADLVNGGSLPSSGNVTHAQVYGSVWHKIAFRLKMNSAPNEPDGIFQQFLNDQLIVDSLTVRWTGPTSEPMPKWNAVAFGGNDRFGDAPDSGASWVNDDEREEWYVIDDVKVYSGLPEGLV